MEVAAVITEAYKLSLGEWRDAGNVVETVGLGSIQYAVEHLGVPLIVVLGHRRCGAVQAAIAVVKDNATFPGSIGQMIEPVIPAVLKAQGVAGDLQENIIRENVRRKVTRLRASTEPILMEPLHQGRLRIVGATMISTTAGSTDSWRADKAAASAICQQRKENHRVSPAVEAQ